MCLPLFVYGTLSPDLAPPALQPFVRQLTEIGKASIAGILYDLGEYPGAVEPTSLENTYVAGGVGGNPEEPRVHGTLYELRDPKLLLKFDEYEGIDPARPEDSLFVRRQVFARLAKGEQVYCWAYFYNRPVNAAVAIPGGIYSPTNR